MAEYMTGILSNIETKQTQKGKTYLVVTVAGERASAFQSNTHATINALHGKQVSVEYTVSGDEGQYKNLTHIEAQQVGTSPVAPSEMPPELRQPAPTATQSPPNAQPAGSVTVHRSTPTDVSIVRQCCVKAVVHMGLNAADSIEAATMFESWVLDGFAIPERLDRGRNVPDDDVPF